jgi:transposase
MIHFEREEDMQKRRKRHPEEFKRQIVAIYESSDRSAASLEREYELSRGSVWRWTKQYGTEEEEGEGGRRMPREVGSAEAERIRKLERENEILRQERDILKKAIAIFSQGKPTSTGSSKGTKGRGR